jgi:hypothetical protein
MISGPWFWMLAATSFLDTANGILMKKELRQSFFPLAALRMTLLLCFCDEQAERENQLL